MLVYLRDGSAQTIFWLCLFVGWLFNVPATCQCISGTDLHRQFFGYACLLVGCLTSQQHASVSQGRVCTDNFLVMFVCWLVV